MRSRIGTVLVVTALLAGSGVALRAHTQEKPAKEKPAKAEKKKRVRRVAPRLKIGTFELSKKRTPQTVGASRGIVGASVVPLAPRLGKSYRRAPRLFWRMPAFLNRVTVRLFDSEMNRWEWEVRGTEFQIPGDDIPLQLGAHYRWQLESPTGHLSKSHAFVIVRGSERQQLEQRLARLGAGNTPEQRRARARLFAELGFWYDAVEAYASLIQEFPNQPDLYEERAQVLAQLPISRPESEQDTQKAHDLRTRLPD